MILVHAPIADEGKTDDSGTVASATPFGAPVTVTNVTAVGETAAASAPTSGFSFPGKL